MSLVVSFIFAVALTLVAGFVISSVNGYSYDFADPTNYIIGLVLGLVIYLFGSLIIADGKN